MTVTYTGDRKFCFGIEELTEQLGFSVGINGYEIFAEKTDGRTLRVLTDRDHAKIFYPTDSLFFKGFSLALQYAGKTAEMSVEPIIKTAGTMQDCSDGLMSVSAVKNFIRQSALMGYGYIGLYTETTYFVDGEPYFGYKTGAYSTGELDEMVSYGEKFCVEVIPFVQTLGHLAQLFRWSEYADVRDTGDVLLPEYDRTYSLIEKMIASLRKSYKTNRIHLGMDEAYFLGLGRYRWFVNEDGCDSETLFIDHIKKVVNIAAKYGFTEPEIWFDNIFGMKFKGYIYPPENIFRPFEQKLVDGFPKIKMRFWNYGMLSESEFKRHCDNIRRLSPDIGFASVVHGYTSFAPANAKTAKTIDSVLSGCLNNGISDLLITRWESLQSPFSMLPSYFLFSERFAKGKGYDEEERCKFLFGYTYSEFITLDIPNDLAFSEKDRLTLENNPPYYILAEDLLLGITEKHIPENAGKYYRDCAEKLAKPCNVKSPYANVFRFEKALCDALAEKADLSRTIKELYDAGDRAGLKKVSASIAAAAEKTEIFHDAYREYWLSYNKRFGFELFDMRLGGLCKRLLAVKKIIDDFADGITDKIEELEEQRLPLYKGGENTIACYKGWNNITVGRLMRL